MFVSFTDVINNHAQLGTRPARRQWEDVFNQTYIRPITETLDHSIHAAFSSIMNDTEQGTRYLLFL